VCRSSFGLRASKSVLTRSVRGGAPVHHCPKVVADPVTQCSVNYRSLVIQTMRAFDLAILIRYHSVGININHRAG
jgi:hypothetical protein